MTNMQFLLLGTALVWVGIFLYVLSLIRRQNRTMETLNELRRMLEDDGE
ncbi:MAG: CcmD family protein [Alicyclobacillaceae bacterium]|nr:CcmD family protein [Alicyclobacillaceae bacterium]